MRRILNCKILTCILHIGSLESTEDVQDGNIYWHICPQFFFVLFFSCLLKTANIVFKQFSLILFFCCLLKTANTVFKQFLFVLFFSCLLKTANTVFKQFFLILFFCCLLEQQIQFLNNSFLS